WIGLAGRYLQLDVAFNLLCHVLPQRTFTRSLGLRCGTWLASRMFRRNRRRADRRKQEGRQTFSTCPYSSSTGVARPKIETATLRRPFSSSTSSTNPVNEVNGPSLTRTCSPIS